MLEGRSDAKQHVDKLLLSASIQEEARPSIYLPHGPRYESR